HHAAVDVRIFSQHVVIQPLQGWEDADAVARLSVGLAGAAADRAGVLVAHLAGTHRTRLLGAGEYARPALLTLAATPPTLSAARSILRCAPRLGPLSFLGEDPFRLLVCRMHAVAMHLVRKLLAGNGPDRGLRDL